MAGTAENIFGVPAIFIFLNFFGRNFAVEIFRSNFTLPGTLF